MVGLDRFELSTSPLSGVRSNQLSYRPAGLLPQKKGYRFYTVASTGFAAPCLQYIFEDQSSDLSKLDRRKPKHSFRRINENLQSRISPKRSADCGSFRKEV